MLKHLLKTTLLLFALVVGSGNAWGTDYNELFTITSAAVVTNSSYAAYNTKDYVITFGGNNKSVGTNSNNRSNCNLSNYSKYAVSPVTTSSVASAFACKTSVSNVSKISYTIDGGSNQTNTNVYLLYSSDNLTFSQVTLTKGTQGAAISSGTEYEFASCSGYFALLFVATNSSGNWRIDDVSVTFYETATGVSVSTPSFYPGAGAVTAGSTVTLTQAEADQIRYTTDGSDPTKTTGTVYSDPIEITTATTIKAIAVKGDDVSSVATAAYTISVTAPSFSPESGSYLQGTTITLSSAGNTIYYNLTTDGSTPSEPTSSSTEYTGPIALGSGTTKIKAIAYDAYGNSSSVITRTYIGIAQASLPFSWTGTNSAGKNDLAEKTGVALSLGNDYATSNAPYRLKFDGVGKYVIIYTDEQPLDVTFTAKLFNATTSTGSKMKVQASADGVDYTDIEEFTINGASNSTYEFTTKYAFSPTHRAVKLVLSTKDQNVAVGTISISSSHATISINAACTDGTGNYYGTYSNSDAFVVPADLTVSAVKVTGSTLTLDEYTTGDIVKANTGVLVSATSAGDKTINLSVATGTEKVGNMLKPSGDEGISAANMTEANKLFYRLTMHNGTQCGFWWGAAEGAAFDLGANKAYLAVPNGGGAAKGGFSLNFDDETGISLTPAPSPESEGRDAWYDLQGRRVAQPTKGLYIVNGKKVVIK